MTPDEQQTRTETAAMPAGMPAAAPGSAEIGLAIPEDALILITTGCRCCAHPTARCSRA